MNSGKSIAIGKSRCSAVCVQGEGALRRAGRENARTALAIAVLSALLVIASGTARAQLTVLHAFTVSDGAVPAAGLIADGNGNLYGTTFYGGANLDGTVFAVTPSGAETVLHSFNWTDGEQPSSDLVRDAQGNLYGTTNFGGVGCGTVFRVNPSGVEKVVYNFKGGVDGCIPYAGLVRDVESNLYGTTRSGGTYGYGTVFMIDAVRGERVLHNFTGGADGGSPFCYPSLIQDSKGNLYGTTYAGGANGLGTVFKLAPAPGTSSRLSVLYSFAGGQDGANPNAGVIRDTNGNLYGTTFNGGGANQGTVYELSAAGKESVLHSFGQTGGDGANPYAGVIRDSYGDLFGTTYNGGSYGGGTVFMTNSSGSEGVVYSFTGGADGVNPFGGLIQDAQGNLYGTTQWGGANGVGTVFKMTP